MIYKAASLRTASAAMNVVSAPSPRNNREGLIRVAMLYPAGLRSGRFAKVDA